MRSESPRHLTHGRVSKWDAAGILLDAPHAGVLDLAEVFGNRRPVEIEIGTGKGGFLLARARSRGELNFLGIEYARSYCCYAADRIRRAGLTNVRMICAEAGELVRKCLGDESIWRVHIYFPDPWPKRRHHRRRTIDIAFLAEIGRVLKRGGQLIIVTDHLDYFQHIERVLANTAGLGPLNLCQVLGAMTADSQGELVGTNFERKYIAQGRAFYGAALMKYA